MFKKKVNFQPELDTANELITQFKSQDGNGVKTLSTDVIESHLKDYRSLSETINKKKANESKKSCMPKQLSDMMEELKNCIVHQFMRNFSVYSNNSIRAKELSDIPATIEKVEHEFITKVNRAQNYFGKFLEGEFHFGITVTEMYEPHSIAEIREALTNVKNNWASYQIDSGCPQPLYKDKFNDILKRCIENYISEA